MTIAMTLTSTWHIDWDGRVGFLIEVGALRYPQWISLNTDGGFRISRW